MPKYERAFSKVLERMRHRTTDDSDIDYLKAFYADYDNLRQAWISLRLTKNVPIDLTKTADQITGLPTPMEGD